MLRFFNLTKVYFWPFVAFLTLLLYALLPYQSGAVESYYSRGFFRLYRRVWDLILSQVPVPLVYFFIAGLLYLILRGLRFLIYDKSTWRGKLKRSTLRIVQVVSVLCVVFYWGWAFNYKRINPLHELLPDSVLSVSINEDELFNELQEVTCILTDLRGEFQDSIKWTEFTFPGEDIYRDHLEATFDRLNQPYIGHVRVRMLYPKGSLLHFSTAGIYLPFVGEGHIDPGLHPLTWPFTMSHEMSHGYGFTGEDLCNFWALLSCINSNSKIMQYSGYFAYWRYLRANANASNKKRFSEYVQDVYPLLTKDLYEIAAFSNCYVDILPKLRDLFYDNYLKSHGIKDGLTSYSRIILLVHAWKQQYGTLYLNE